MKNVLCWYLSLLSITRFKFWKHILELNWIKCWRLILAAFKSNFLAGNTGIDCHIWEAWNFTKHRAEFQILSGICCSFFLYIPIIVFNFIESSNSWYTWNYYSCNRTWCKLFVFRSNNHMILIEKYFWVVNECINTI